MKRIPFIFKMILLEELAMFRGWNTKKTLEDGQYFLIQFSEVLVNFGFLNSFATFFVVALEGPVVQRDQAESG